jgi:itaconate CoA-transferase
MTLPLSGLLVVSLEQAVAAPMCTCRLADAGARVIKIERPEGDFARGYDDLVHGECSYFVWLNRGGNRSCSISESPATRRCLKR